MAKKNILLFLPVYFSTVDKLLTPQLQFDYIFEELSNTTNFIYEYKQKYCSDYDTYIIYSKNCKQKKSPISSLPSLQKQD